ncbi:MAG: hypothetical protein KJ634_09605 [Gammaproteobacteria bacterium]|nr:hypothetical protein [Gammaproteobacteria bacterium]MBU1415864.1 hypothetical protein [Gammaproteobacteria bacterium]
MSRLLASGSFRAVPPPEDWRAELEHMLGTRPRRVGAWAELALYGALRCMAEAGEATLPAGDLLLLGSRHGTHAATAVALGQMTDDLPMPLAFLQTQPSQVLALLAARLNWQGHACFFAGADLAQVRAQAELLVGQGGALIGWLDDVGTEATEWLRLRPVLPTHLGKPDIGR